MFETRDTTAYEGPRFRKPSLLAYKAAFPDAPAAPAKPGAPDLQVRSCRLHAAGSCGDT
jgi:hypothetical protein